MWHIQFKRNIKTTSRYSGALIVLTPWVGCIALLLAGCQHKAPKPQPPALPVVTVSAPLEETVTEFEEVTGRTWAINTIEVRSRVSGYLDKVYFKEGGEVKTGDILFVVDQRPFKAELDKAAAAVKQGEAHLERLVRQEVRMKKLLPSKAITMDEFEAITYERDEADAALSAAKAAEEIAQLNFDYTTVKSTISGTIGRRLVDPGNLVKADETPLASIVSLDPIHAYFDLDERTVLKLRRLIQQGLFKSPQDAALSVKIAVADDPEYTIDGSITFIDNQLDGSTGTLRGRAVVENRDGLLSPGLFVRVRVPNGDAHKATLIREEALGSDQGQRFVYIVEKVKNKDTGIIEDVVAYRRVEIGMLIGGRRVISSGLKPEDRVIITGLQRVRPGAKVIPKAVDKDGKPIDEATAVAAAPADQKPADAKPTEQQKAEQKTAEVARGAGK